MKVQLSDGYKMCSRLPQTNKKIRHESGYTNETAADANKRGIKATHQH